MNILFLVTEDWYFVSHRLRLAKKLRNEGNTVSVGCRVSDKREVIETNGISVYPISFSREKLSPLAVLGASWEIRKLLRRVRPDLIHFVALRAIIVGWLATRLMDTPVVLNAVTGMGSLFSGEIGGLKIRWTRMIVRILLRRVFLSPESFTVWQNRDDMGSFIANGIAPQGRSFLVKGAGVEVVESPFQSEPNGETLVVLYVGRLLKDKGIGELLAASERLLERGVAHKLRIVGETDYCNPGRFTEDEIAEWAKRDCVEILGKRADVLEQMRAANLVVLPSYREGLPKVLLEAGSVGRAVVTCDVPGCREIVIDGLNGLIVPPQDFEGLAWALERLLRDSRYRKSLAENNYKRVKNEFSSDVIDPQMIRLHSEIMEKGA